MPAGRRGDGHHPRRAAVIQMRAVKVLAEDTGDVEAFCRVTAIVMELNPPLRGKD